MCEFIDGATLDEQLKQGPFAASEAAAIVGELAAALQYAHEQGVVHRDIKPANIILDRQQRAHLMDFGLAKRDTGELTMTSDGRVPHLRHLQHAQLRHCTTCRAATAKERHHRSASRSTDQPIY